MFATAKGGARRVLPASAVGFQPSHVMRNLHGTRSCARSALTFVEGTRH
jgi:hypothetical protein